MMESKLLADFFEMMSVPAYVVDAELRIVLGNRLARDFVVGAGFQGDSVYGVALREAAPFLPPNIGETYLQVMQTGQPSTEEVVYEIRGRKLYLDVVRLPIFNGNVVTHVGVVFNIVTELREAQMALRDSEETARALMNSSSESMFLIGPDQTILISNATGAARLGFTVDQVRGKFIDEVLPVDVSETRKRYYHQVIQSGQTVRFTDRRAGRVYDTTMLPVPNPGGGARMIAVHGRDITENESLLRALGESAQRFRDLFEHVPVPTYVWHWDGSNPVLHQANAAAREVNQGWIESNLGKTAEEMYGATMPEIVRDLSECFSTQSRIVRDMQYHFALTGQLKFLKVHYEFVPPADVIIHTVDLTERRRAELAMQQSYSEVEERVEQRTRELALVNEQLRVEREALNQKTIAMRELIAQLSESKVTLAGQIQTNLQNAILPILERLNSRLDEPGRNYVQLLNSSLNDILSPHLTELQKNHPHLTAHEIDLCNLIKGGLSCKEIAQMRGRSVQTVLKQRKTIRKKLGLVSDKVNLRNYLMSVRPDGGGR